MAGDINVMALVKGEERYVFLFDDERRAEALRTLGRYASDSELSFNWYDAAVLSQKMRRTAPAPVEPPVMFDRVDEPLLDEDFLEFPLLEDLPGMDDPLIGDEPIF